MHRTVPSHHRRRDELAEYWFEKVAIESKVGTLACASVTVLLDGWP